MARARKELKEVSKNYVRLVVLEQGLFLLSVIFLLEFFWPGLPILVPLSNWILIPAIMTWGLTVSLHAARWRVPSLRKQALAFRARLALWLTARRLAPWVYLATMAGCMYTGLFVMLPVASWIFGDSNGVAHNLALLAWVAVFSLVSLAFYNSVMRGGLGNWAKARRDWRGPA